MRTTLTIDDDLGARLEDLARERRTSFKEVVNATLRRGLEAPASPRQPFRVKARALGLRPGVQLDNIGDLLEQLEGAAHK